MDGEPEFVRDLSKMRLKHIVDEVQNRIFYK